MSLLKYGRQTFIPIQNSRQSYRFFYICIMVLRIKADELETKESKLKANQRGKEKYFALSYSAPFCVPHTLQHLAFDEKFAAAFVFILNSGSCREPAKHVNRCKTQKFLFSFLFFPFCIVLDILFLFYFQFQHCDVEHCLHTASLQPHFPGKVF